MKTLLVSEHATDINTIKLAWIEQPVPSLSQGECLVKISTSGINPSDVLAVTGYFHHAVLPRIPGRDFSGIVVDGPASLLNKKVWGTGGAAGISFDGTQAEYIKLSVNEIAEVPNNLDLITAGAQTLPYVTAHYSLVHRARVKANESVLVTGALGQVGSAAMSICAWKNCNAIALVRGKEEIAKAKQLGWNVINSEDSNLGKNILDANGGKPIQVIFNSLGNLYWQDFMNSLAEFGRVVTISARENFREAKINLFDNYRSNQEIIGVNTVSFDFSENAKLLNELKLGFEQKKLIPLNVEQSMIYSPEKAAEAYQMVMQGSQGKRVVIKFS